MKILHTESSNGWGGQEMRILSEAKGMRQRGHEVIIATVKGGGLAQKAKEAGFKVYELSFKKKKWASTLLHLLKILSSHQIELVNTHSSWDAWIGGFAARMQRKKILRTRHLSTPTRKGLNSYIIYKALADFVVTTSSCIIPTIVKQARLCPQRCKLVATGVDKEKLAISQEAISAFREQFGILPTDFVVGTVCIIRSWKGIQDLVEAAYLLKDVPSLKWVIVGDGNVAAHKELVRRLELEKIVIFTGHLDPPYHAMAALDVFALLSTAHEGISQACLQAAYLKKPLLTTHIGGLPEICQHQKTGLIVPPSQPKEVAKAVLKLKNDAVLRQELGQMGHWLIENKFTIEHTLKEMEKIYTFVSNE